MLAHYWISKSWMVSATAQRVYRLTAWLSIGFFVLLVATPFLPNMSEGLNFLYRVSFFTGLLGAAITLVAMEYFLFSFDQSSSAMKVLWFVMLCCAPLGPAIYCLFGYSRSKILDKRPVGRPEELAEETRGS